MIKKNSQRTDKIFLYIFVCIFIAKFLSAMVGVVEEIIYKYNLINNVSCSLSSYYISIAIEEQEFS